jgi:hypothetical protein
MQEICKAEFKVRQSEPSESYLLLSMASAFSCKELLPNGRKAESRSSACVSDTKLAKIVKHLAPKFFLISTHSVFQM